MEGKQGVGLENNPTEMLENGPPTGDVGFLVFVPPLGKMHMYWTQIRREMSPKAVESLRDGSEIRGLKPTDSLYLDTVVPPTRLQH